jgi:uncharacterized protein YdaU (DUF1376 family)
VNFYPHHIGDYLTATVHLSWVEDCAYRRLLDLYYSREQAIPGDVAQAARLCRATTKEERKAVETVLSEFFTLTEKGWFHSRCEEEIAKALEAAERARQNGRRGGRPAKQKPTQNPEETQPVIPGNPEESNSKAPNPNPITNTSEAEASGAVAPAKSADVMTKDELWSAGKSLLAQAGIPKAQCGSLIGKLVKDYGDVVVIEAVRAAVVTRPADPVAYIKAACMHSAGQRANVAPKSFAEQDREAGMRRWEEMTGRVHPDRQQGGAVLAVTNQTRDVVEVLR